MRPGISAHFRASRALICLAAVMVEAASFIVRTSLIKILADDLTENFATDATADAYFRGIASQNERA